MGLFWAVPVMMVLSDLDQEPFTLYQQFLIPVFSTEHHYKREGWKIGTIPNYELMSGVPNSVPTVPKIRLNQSLDLLQANDPFRTYHGDTPHCCHPASSLKNNSQREMKPSIADIAVMSNDLNTLWPPYNTIIAFCLFGCFVFPNERQLNSQIITLDMSFDSLVSRYLGQMFSWLQAATSLLHVT